MGLEEFTSNLNNRERGGKKLIAEECPSDPQKLKLTGYCIHYFDPTKCKKRKECPFYKEKEMEARNLRS